MSSPKNTNIDSKNACFGCYDVAMDMNEAVSKAISAERAIANMTVRELAAQAKIPERSLMRVLQAERDIKVNQIAQIAEALKLYPHEIIEHAEVIIDRASRQSTNLANVTPLKSPQDEPLQAVAKQTPEIDVHEDDYQ